MLKYTTLQHNKGLYGNYTGKDTRYAHSYCDLLNDVIANDLK